MANTTECLDPVMSGNGTGVVTEQKNTPVDPNLGASDFEAEGFSAGVTKFPDFTKTLSLGKADGHTEEASRAAAQKAMNGPVTFNELQSVKELKDYYETTLNKNHLKNLLKDNSRNAQLKSQNGTMILDTTHCKLDQ